MQADLVALRVAEQRGELLDAGEVEREWISILTAVRSGYLAIPRRIGAQLPHLSPADVAENRCRGQCRANGIQLNLLQFL